MRKSNDAVYLNCKYLSCLLRCDASGSLVSSLVSFDDLEAIFDFFVNSLLFNVLDALGDKMIENLHFGEVFDEF